MSVIETIIDIPAEHQQNVCGQFDEYLKKMERTLHVTMIFRDGSLKIIGPEDMIRKAKSVFSNLLELSRRGTAITQQKAALEDWQSQSGSSEVWTTDADGVDIQEGTSESIILTYSIKDGSVMQRKYVFPVTSADLTDSTTLSARLSALLNRPDVVYDSYFGNVEPEDQLVSVAIVNLYNPEEDTYGFEYLPSELLEPLMEAIQTDIAEGNLGRRYLLEDRNRMDNCCYADLELTYRVPLGSTSNTANTVAVQEYGPTGSAVQEDTYTITITLQKSALHTLEVLKDYPNAFLSQVEVQQADNN